MFLIKKQFTLRKIILNKYNTIIQYDLYINSIIIYIELFVFYVKQIVFVLSSLEYI